MYQPNSNTNSSYGPRNSNTNSSYESRNSNINNGIIIKLEPAHEPRNSNTCTNSSYDPNVTPSTYVPPRQHSQPKPYPPRHTEEDSQYIAREIWLNSFSEYGNNYMTTYLDDLYHHLMKEFKHSTKCNKQQPTIEQIKAFFLRHGGEVFDIHVEYLTFGYVRLKDNNMMYEPSLNFIICSYLGNMQLVHISKDNFEKFFAWFESICCIIKDLRPMYNRADDPLIALFYGRATAQQALNDKPVGTFLLRLSSVQNGLAITYKTPGKIQNILLTRMSNEMYKVGKSDKETLLFNLIRPWPKLQYLYTPNKLIRKTHVF